MQTNGTEGGLGSGEQLVNTDTGSDVAELINPDDDDIIEVADSIEDDIEEAIEQLSNASENPKPEAAPEEKEAQPPLQESEEIKAPDRFTADYKEKFNKLPHWMKDQGVKAFKEMQADYTKSKTFLNESQRQVDGVIRTVNTYMSKWGINGVSPDQAILALTSAQDQLTHDDKNIRKEAYAKLFVNSGLSGDDFLDIINGNSQTQQQAPQQNYQPPPLTSAEKMRQEYVDSQIAQNQERQVNSIFQEIEQVKESKDVTGRYLYPKLHDPSFIERAKPHVAELMQNSPVQIGYGEAFRQVYHLLNGDFINHQTRLPTANNSTQIVRNIPTFKGGGNSQASTKLKSSEVPDSIEESIRMSIEQLQRGGSY